MRKIEYFSEMDQNDIELRSHGFSRIKRPSSNKIWPNLCGPYEARDFAARSPVSSERGQHERKMDSLLSQKKMDSLFFFSDRVSGISVSINSIRKRTIIHSDLTHKVCFKINSAPEPDLQGKTIDCTRTCTR
jgi:hypothetical protein